MSVHDRGTDVMALADGAGSAALSDYGAQCAIEYVCRKFTDDFDLLCGEKDGVAVKKSLLSGLTEALTREAYERDCELNDLASTLLAVAVKDGRFLIMHIGDGVIGYVKNDRVLVASSPENGEFANTTYFTTSPNVISDVKLLKGNVNEITAFIVMSDGTEASLYDKRRNCLSEGLCRLSAQIRICDPGDCALLLNQAMESVIKQNTFDDCSLGLMVKNEPPFEGFNTLSFDEQNRLLKIAEEYSDDQEALHRQNARLGKILNAAREPILINPLRRKSGLRMNELKKHLAYLEKLNFMYCDDERYKTALEL